MSDILIKRWQTSTFLWNLSDFRFSLPRRINLSYIQCVLYITLLLNYRTVRLHKKRRCLIFSVYNWKINPENWDANNDIHVNCIMGTEYRPFLWAFVEQSQHSFPWWRARLLNCCLEVQGVGNCIISHPRHLVKRQMSGHYFPSHNYVFQLIAR